MWLLPDMVDVQVGKRSRLQAALVPVYRCTLSQNGYGKIFFIMAKAIIKYFNFLIERLQ
jgi:hypothetical protein